MWAKLALALKKVVVDKVKQKAVEAGKNAVNKVTQGISSFISSLLKAIKFLVANWKIILIGLGVALLASLIMYILSKLTAIFQFWGGVTEYSGVWNYTSLEDKNLDTELIAEDILYETFYEVVSETSYYQVFNSTYTVGAQEDIIVKSRFGAFWEGVSEGVGNFFSGTFRKLGNWIQSWTGFENMDVRMTVHDANFRTISNMQKALSYSDNATPEEKATTSQLALFRDYYGRENDFAVSSGLLKTLNDQVLNIYNSNANEDAYLYPETFTKPVQFTYDYFRVIPTEQDDGGYKLEPYTYVTKRVLLEDIMDGSKISVSNALYGDSSKNKFANIWVTSSELLSKASGPKEPVNQDKKDYDDWFKENTGLTKEDTGLISIDDVYDLEGIIVSAPSPYLYEYIVLERNSRKGLQDASDTKNQNFDFLALNNVAKYVTIKEYNDYSEYPKESQVKLYWKIVEAGDDITKNSSISSTSYPASIITDSTIDFTTDFGFTQKGEDGRPIAKSTAFYGIVNNSYFVYASEVVNGLRLIGPFANYEDMENNKFIPYRTKDSTSAKLEGFDDDTNAVISVEYDIATESYAFVIEYDQYPVRKKVVDVEKAESKGQKVDTENMFSITTTNEEGEEEITYYEWTVASEATHTTIIAEAILTFPERHYQLAPLTDENENLVSTGRVYVNTGEYSNIAVRDTYRRSMDYQSRLMAYLAEALNDESTVNEIKEKFAGTDFIMSCYAFFINAPKSIAETHLYIIENIENDVLLATIYSAYLPTAEFARLQLQKGTFREALINYYTEKLEDAIENGAGEVVVEYTDEQMAFVIYKFETEVVIPNGTIGVELEESNGFNDYTDTVGLTSDVYKELEKQYAAEYRAEFNEYIDRFISENGLSDISNTTVYNGGDDVSIAGALNPYPGTRVTTYYDAYGNMYYEEVEGITMTQTFNNDFDEDILSSSYLPTSISLSYGYALSQAEPGTDGDGDGIVEVGIAEDNVFGFDFKGNLRKGETQLVNLLKHEEGQKLIEFYTGIKPITEEKKYLLALSQRFLQTVESNGITNGYSGYDGVGSSTLTSKAIKRPTNDISTTDLTVYRKKSMDSKYEYRTLSSALDVSIGRFRDGENYRVLPYEVRSVRDYGLASIMEYMEGLSVKFKRGLYYDEQYQEYALNAFVYYLQKNASSYEGIVDVSNYDFANEFFDDLERGFYPAEYFDIDSENDLLASEFILGGANDMANDIGQGAASQVHFDNSNVAIKNLNATQVNGTKLIVVGDSTVKNLNTAVGLTSMGVKVISPSSTADTEIMLELIDQAVQATKEDGNNYDTIVIYAGIDEIFDIYSKQFTIDDSGNTVLTPNAKLDKNGNLILSNGAIINKKAKLTSGTLPDWVELNETDKIRTIYFLDEEGNKDESRNPIVLHKKDIGTLDNNEFVKSELNLNDFCDCISSKCTDLKTYMQKHYYTPINNKLTGLNNVKVYIVNLTNVTSDVAENGNWWNAFWGTDENSIQGVNSIISSSGSNAWTIIDANDATDNFWGGKVDEDFVSSDGKWQLTQDGYIHIWNDLIVNACGLNASGYDYASLITTAPEATSPSTAKLGEKILYPTDKYGIILYQATSTMLASDGNEITKYIFSILTENNETKTLECYNDTAGWNYELKDEDVGSNSTTSTGSFFANEDGISASGTVVNENSYLRFYYNEILDNFKDPSIYFDCFVPYLRSYENKTDQEVKEMTYKSPTDYYLTWLERSKKDIANATAAEKLEVSRTWYLKGWQDEDKCYSHSTLQECFENKCHQMMVTKEVLASQIKDYFKDNETDKLYKTFAINLQGTDNKLLYESIYTKEEFLTENVTKTTISNFGLNKMDAEVAQAHLVSGKSNIAKEYSAQINDYSWTDMNSTESMFLINQVVTFLGRFEYTYKDTMESVSPLSQYDKNRLVGMYYYDRHYQVEDLKYSGMVWKYETEQVEITKTSSYALTSKYRYPNSYPEVKNEVLNLTPSVLNEGNHASNYLTQEEFDKLKASFVNYSETHGFVIHEIRCVGVIQEETVTQDQIDKKEKEGETDTGWENKGLATTTYSTTYYYEVTYKYPYIDTLTIKIGNSYNEIFFDKDDDTFNKFKNASVNIYNDLMKEAENSMNEAEDLTRKKYTLEDFTTTFNNLSIYKYSGDKVDISKHMKFEQADSINEDDKIVEILKQSPNGKYIIGPYYNMTTYNDTVSLATLRTTKDPISIEEENPDPEDLDVKTEETSGDKTKTVKTVTYTYPTGSKTLQYYDYSTIKEYDEKIPVFISLSDSYDYNNKKDINFKNKDNRTVAQAAPLMRNYFGANWKIYLKELAFYLDGETVKSWGNRVIFTDEEKEMINPDYENFEEDMEKEKKSRLSYFVSYLMSFETYIPATIKADKDLAERIDLVQNFADLTANGQLVFTKDITDMFTNEAGSDYWENVYNSWDQAFKDTGLKEIGRNGKIKAFAQILQGIWEVRMQRAITTNLEALASKGIDKENKTNIEIMTDIIARSATQSVSDTTNIRKYIESRGKDFVSADGQPLNLSLTYENFPCLGWGGFEVKYSSKQTEIKTTESSETYQTGLWYKDETGINSTLNIEYESGKVVKDERLVATEVMTFVAHRFLQNLNKWNGIHQAIYATTLTFNDMASIVANSATSDLTLSGSYPQGEVITQVFSFVKNVNVRQTLATACSAEAQVEIGKNAEQTKERLTAVPESNTEYSGLTYIWSNGSETDCSNLSGMTIENIISTAVNDSLPIAKEKAPEMVTSDEEYAGFMIAYIAAMGMVESGLRPTAVNASGNTYGAWQITATTGYVNAGNCSVPPSSDSGTQDVLYNMLWSACWTAEHIITNYNTVEQKFRECGYTETVTVQDTFLYLANCHNKGSGGASSWLKGLSLNGGVNADWPTQSAINFEAYEYMLEKSAPEYSCWLENDEIKTNWGDPKYMQKVMEYLTDDFDFTPFGSGSLAVSSRSNIASNLKQMSLKDYRAYTSTSLYLVSRPVTRDDAERIYMSATEYKNTDPYLYDVDTMTEEQIFGEYSTFSILDLLGNRNAKGLYERNKTTSFEYLFEGVYDGYDLGAINWVESDHLGNTDIIAVALREAANTDDGSGKKYQVYMGYGYTDWVHWCACFSCWCGGQLGYVTTGADSLVFRSGSCGYMISGSKNLNGAQVVMASENLNPAPGDYIFFDWQQDGVVDHVGLTIGSDDNYIYTVEGNTSDLNGYYTSGLGGSNHVKVKSYAKTNPDVWGYIIPDYSRVEENDSMLTFEELLDSEGTAEYIYGEPKMTYREYFDLVEIPGV